MAYQVNQEIRHVFSLIDPVTEDLETGKTDDDWTKQAYLNATTDAQTVTVAEVADGKYVLQFTPDTIGDWAVAATVTVNSVETFHDFGPYSVESYDLDAVQTNLSAVQTTLGAIDTTIGAVDTTIGAINTTVGTVHTTVGTIETLIGTDADATDAGTLFGKHERLSCFTEHKWAISGSSLIIYDTDDATPLVTFTLAPNATAPTSRTPA